MVISLESCQNLAHFINVIVIKHLYSATQIRGAPDPGQSQIGRFSGACGTDQVILEKGLYGTEVTCSSWMGPQ